MSFPSFFDAVPTITMRDPLAVFLGTSDDGLIEYRYEDAVRLAGHSCPTVASTWSLARAGLIALFGEDVPERGGIDVFMPGPADAGVIGVEASVLKLVTGAAASAGFGGLGQSGRFSRRNLLTFDAAIEGRFVLRRRDTGAGVRADFDMTVVPRDGELAELMPGAVSGRLDLDGQARFSGLWQQRVARFLVEPDVLKAGIRLEMLT